MRVPQCQKCQTTPPATRTGKWRQPAGQAAGSGRHTAESRQQATGSRRQAAHSRKQKAGGGRAAIRRAAIRRAGGSIAHREDFMYIQTARNGRRCTHRHGGSPRHRESEIASEPCRLGSGKNHAGKQVLSTEIPEILRIREIQRMFTNYHKKRAEKSCILDFSRFDLTD